MKLLIKVIFIAILYTSVGYCQQLNKSDIIGIWQFNSREINAGWFDNYQFFLDGNFCFNTNQNDATRRIISIGGKFNIIGDTLILHTTYSKELKGGYLVRSETAGSSGWEINGAIIDVIKFKSPKLSYLQLENCKEHEKLPCILLDKRKYFKLENNPKNYH